MSGRRLLASRRATLSLALAAPLALTACTGSDPGGDDGSTAGPDAGAGGASSASPDPVAADAEVLGEARRAIGEVAAFLTLAAERHPDLTRQARALLALHAAHQEVLDDGTEVGDVAPTPVARQPRRARAQVAAQEAQLADTLAACAQRASSGDLARALASMSAALGQRTVSGGPR